jgi:hypothetical protein
METKYFKVSNRKSFSNYYLILKLIDSKLEVINNIHQSWLNDLEFTQDKKGNYHVNKRYSLEEVKESDLEEINRKNSIDEMNWDFFMSSSENYASSGLFGLGGEKLV